MNSLSKESQNTEWKASWHDDYLKWICGFANAEGGRIFIGKDDSGDAVGVDKVDELLEILPNKIRDKLGLMPTVDLHEKSGKSYIEITVKASNVPISLRGVYYWRSGSVLQQLKGSALNDFLLRKMGLSWDGVVEVNATLEDIDPLAIERFKADAAAAGRLPDISTDSTADILRKLRLTTKEGITRAAVILFGKDPGEFYPNLFVKIGRFGDSEIDLRFQEVCEGNLIQVLPDILEQLEKKFLIKPVRFEGLRRIEELEYPVDALREMLLNALVHRNYLGSMIQMKVFDNRLTLWNAGGLPDELSIQKLFEVHESIPRNPLIAEVCYKAGYIDSWGRGVEKISDACKRAGIAAPVFRERSGGVLVELLRQDAMKTPADGKVKNEVKNEVKNKVKTPDLLIDFLRNNPDATLQDAANVLNKSISSMEKVSAQLRKQGKIRYVGPQKGGHWEVLDD